MHVRCPGSPDGKGPGLPAGGEPTELRRIVKSQLCPAGAVQREKVMKPKILVAVVAATMFATPVLADFFIVREGVSGPCLVVDARPTDVKTIVIGNKVYTARADAERDIPNLCPTAPAVEGQVVAPPGAVIVVPPPARAPVVAPPRVQAPAVAVPAVPAPVPAAPCFYQGRAFSDGSTNPMGATCDKGTWR
jgi:hypothetical protein